MRPRRTPVVTDDGRQPLPHHARRELGAVIAADVLGYTACGHQPRQPLQHVVAAEVPRHVDAQALPRELVHHHQHPERSSVVRHSAHEVVRPHVVLVLGPQADAASVVEPQPHAFGLAFGHLQPLSPPDPFDAFVVHVPSFASEHRVDPGRAVPTVHRRQFHDPSRQPILVVPLHRRVPLHRSGLAQHLARTPLAHAQFGLNVLDGDAPTCRAQKFGRAASRRIALSSSASASRRLSRAFSCSSSLNRLA